MQDGGDLIIGESPQRFGSVQSRTPPRRYTRNAACAEHCGSQWLKEHMRGAVAERVFEFMDHPCAVDFGHPALRPSGEMRYDIFSLSKSLGAALTLLWLAQKYGPQVFDEKITDYVSIPASHDGWKDVTFGKALDMTTGIGNLTPQRVDFYVEADSALRAGLVWRASSLRAKLIAMAEFGNYPWRPGEVTRYRSSDTGNGGLCEEKSRARC